MARDIDFDNLTDDDMPYLQARHFLVEEAELLGHEGVREKVDAWTPGETPEADARQDVRPAPQTTGDADLPTTPQTPDEEEEEEVDYSEASKDELVAEAKRRELPASGTKDEIIARLEAYDAEHADEEEEIEE